MSHFFPDDASALQNEHSAQTSTFRQLETGKVKSPTLSSNEPWAPHLNFIKKLILNLK